MEKIIINSDASTNATAEFMVGFREEVSIEIISNSLDQADSVVTIQGSNTDGSGFVTMKDESNQDVTQTLDGTDGSDYIDFQHGTFNRQYCKVNYTANSVTTGTIIIKVFVK